MFHRTTRQTTLAALFVFTLTGTASGFDILDEDAARWDDDPSYSVANAPPEVGLAAHRVAVRAAFTTWRDVARSSLNFVERNDNGDIPVQYLGNWPREFGEFAAGITNTSRRGGRITSARISLNGQHFDWSTDGGADTSDVQGVTTHEVGHAVGLGHSFYRASTMYWTGDAGDDLGMRSLAPDDARGARYLYGQGGEGRLCDTCEDNDDCAAGGVCLGLEPGRAYCGEPCDNGRCPANAACFELRDGGTSCAPLAQVCSDEGEGEFADGDYCFGSDQCGAGRMCYPTADSAQCATVCTPGEAPCARGQCVPFGADDIPGLCLVGGDTPFGDACENHTDCATTLCMPVDEEASVCSQACDPAADDCPRGLCVETMDPVLPGVCIPPGEGAFGEPCDSNLDCASSMCLPLDDDRAVCAAECDPDRRECPGGRCFETEDANTPGVCVPTGDAPFGALCESDLECATGLCLPLSDDLAVCTQECDVEADDCPGGDCIETGVPELPAVCFPPGEVTEGGRCGAADQRCADPLSCIGDAGAFACRGPCAPFGQCAAGRGCSPVSADLWLCLPEDGPREGATCETVCAGGLLCLPMGEDEPDICVRPCFPGGADCGDGQCLELVEGLGACPTGRGGFAEACEGHLDCLSTVCVPAADGGACSRTCGDDQDCGDGWRCEETRSRGRVCFPEDGTGGESGAGGLGNLGDLPDFGGASGEGGATPPAGAGGASGDPELGGAGHASGGGGSMSAAGGAPFEDGPGPTPIAANDDEASGLFGCEAAPASAPAGAPFWLLVLCVGGWRIRRMNVRLGSPSSPAEE